MCGICGDIRSARGGVPSADVIGAMNDAQRHRGPDDAGLWLRGPVGLGHRRLSILDLGGGHQPMSDPTEQIVVTYNGEIYNFVELRDELRARGRQCCGTGDTEVLIQAYLEWGVDMLPRLSGMFAFGLYDARHDRFFAARDPIGQKPFLYYRDREGLIFASELTALLRHPRVPRALDRDAVASYLVYESFPAPQTPLAGIRKLPPGHALTYAPSSGTLRLWKYWDHPRGDGARLSRRAPTRADEEALAEQLRASVQRHLRSDVPVGVYLSGGVDSTMLALLASDLLGGPNLQTFTVGQVEPSFDESAQARQLARALGTRHHELQLTAERCLASVPEAVAHLDEPLADPGYLAVCQVASLASQHVKVVLAGDGGDEFLCGYEPFKVWDASEWLHRAPGMRRALRVLVDRTPAQYGYMGLWYRARHFLRGLDVPAPLRNSYWISAFTPAEARQALVGGAQLPAFEAGEGGHPRLVEPVLALHRAAGAATGTARLGLEYQQTYLPNCICAHSDKANMRYSLEARSPFLDPEVMRYLNGLPTAWKLHGWQSKWILRRWIARRLGRALPVKKHGFAVPISWWLRGELRAYAAAHLARDAIAAVGVFDPQVVERLWNEHQRGRANHAKKLWTLLVFQAWHDRHVRAAPSPAPAATVADRSLKVVPHG